MNKVFLDTSYAIALSAPSDENHTCMSFVVMSDQSLTDALTADDHFRQAGFRALL